MIHQTSLGKKYNRFGRSINMLNHNLWNMSVRLSPKYKKFSADGTTFKKQVVDVEIHER